MLLDEQSVLQVEARRLDRAAEQLQWIAEVGEVEISGLRIGHVYGHAMAAPRAPRTLPVVRRARGDVAHEHRIERANVYAEFQRRRADQSVYVLGLTLELILDALAHVCGDLSGVLGRA